MKKNKGFTLIELLAVIVILAIIALIAVPQVIKILNKARLSSAEDSTYGIVKSVDNYVASFLLQNDGSFPNIDLEFSCNGTECSLNSLENFKNYNLKNLESLSFKGTVPNLGNIIVSDGGKNIFISNLKINGFTCYYLSKTEKAECGKTTTLENKEYSSGDAIKLGGYNWHVIGKTSENITLLMDAGQIDDMVHCTNDTDPSTDCGVDSTGKYYVYSWNKSLINKYLNEILYPELKNKITNEIVPVNVCTDSSHGDGVSTYGGYLKTEIDKISGASCNNGYETDYVRLMTYSEYFNLSPYYSEINTNYTNVIEITRLLASSDYANWLYCNSNKCGSNSTDWKKGIWWIMNSVSGNNSSNVQISRSISSSGAIRNDYGENIFGVRPVITIRK